MFGTSEDGGMTILDLSMSSAGRLFKTQGDAPFHSH